MTTKVFIIYVHIKKKKKFYFALYFIFICPFILSDLVCASQNFVIWILPDVKTLQTRPFWVSLDCYAMAVRSWTLPMKISRLMIQRVMIQIAIVKTWRLKMFPHRVVRKNAVVFRRSSWIVWIKYKRYQKAAMTCQRRIVVMLFLWKKALARFHFWIRTIKLHIRNCHHWPERILLKQEVALAALTFYSNQRENWILQTAILPRTNILKQPQELIIIHQKILCVI